MAGAADAQQQQIRLLDSQNICNIVIKNCVKCSRFNGDVPLQIMADLPSERLDASTPFINTGVDFAGPIVTKPNYKNYIAIFVCFATKAVHIELVTDLSKDSCILALKRFISRRGLPEKLFSDNGSNFIAARNDFLEMIFSDVRAILSKDSGGNSVTDFVIQKGIQWVTIPPRAPHFEGLCEAAVKSMKRHLRRSVVPRFCHSKNSIHTSSKSRRF